MEIRRVGATPVIESDIAREVLSLAGFPAIGTLQPVSYGISNAKFRVTTGIGDCVLKIYQGPSSTRRCATEAELLRACFSRLPCATPRLITAGESAEFGFCYVLMTWVQGRRSNKWLGEANLHARGEFVKLLATSLRELHMLGIADARRKGTEPRENVRRVEDQDGPCLFRDAEELGLISERDRKNLEREYAKRYVGGCRVHGDLSFDNVLVEDGQAGRLGLAIVDFEHSHVGDRMIDLAKLTATSDPILCETAEEVSSQYLASLEGHGIEQLRRLSFVTLMSDLAVAVDLARDKLPYVYALSTQRHQAWFQLGRFLMGGAGYGGPKRGARLTVENAETAAKVLRRESVKSTCARRRVGCALVGHEGSILDLAVNGLDDDDVWHCWCVHHKRKFSHTLRCPSAHAEEKVLRRNRGVVDFGACGLVTTTAPCLECARQIVDAGIQEVWYSEEFRDRLGLEYLYGSGVLVRYIDVGDAVWEG